MASPVERAQMLKALEPPIPTFQTVTEFSEWARKQICNYNAYLVERALKQSFLFVRGHRAELLEACEQSRTGLFVLMQNNGGNLRTISHIRAKLQS